MFYSHAFLARKSPLGTVWIAAFLQHKLRKSHVAIINISSSVDRIMYPEVPIALRLSGHLLLGVVRIYSKKVEYLHHDCNLALTQIRTMFASVHVNLPEDANRATFQAVTLPDKFELDALELDDNDYGTENTDNHVKTREQITLPDQIPVEGDQYVAFFINEDRIEPSPNPELMADLGIAPMEVDAHPSFPVEKGVDSNDTWMEGSVGIKDPGPSNQAGTTVQNFQRPAIEVQRDVLPEAQDPANDMFGPHENSDQIKGKEIISATRKRLSYSGGQSLVSPSNLKALPVASAEDFEISNTLVSHEQPLPDFALQSSEPVVKQKAKSRKRKRFFEKSIVLTNAEMNKQLNDTIKLKRRRVKLPCSSLAVWKFQKNRQGKQLFHEPVFSGMCHQLLETSNKTFPIHLEAPAEGAQAPAPLPEMDIETEQILFYDHPDKHFQSIPSPSCTPTLPSNLGSASQTGKTLEIDVLSTMENPTVAEQVVFQHETPTVQLEENPNIDDTHYQEMPGLASSPEVDDLKFLEADNTPTGSETNEIDSMSVRTRAVARYLKWQSPVTQLLENQAGNLSLNRILEGKTRKQCARMFFETLVLKSCGFIEVHEEEPYRDITISLTPTLSELKF